MRLAKQWSGEWDSLELQYRGRLDGGRTGPPAAGAKRELLDAMRSIARTVRVSFLPSFESMSDDLTRTARGAIATLRVVVDDTMRNAVHVLVS